MPTVLIVDDDPKLLKMLQRTLFYENLNVLTASNGLEALPIVSAQSPDLIIAERTIISSSRLRWPNWSRACMPCYGVWRTNPKIRK